VRAKLFGRAADSRQRLLLEQRANRARIQRLLERAIDRVDDLRGVPAGA